MDENSMFVVSLLELFEKALSLDDILHTEIPYLKSMMRSKHKILEEKEKQRKKAEAELKSQRAAASKSASSSSKSKSYKSNKKK